MQPTELVTLNMRELDRLKVIQAVVDRPFPVALPHVRDQQVLVNKTSLLLAPCSLLLAPSVSGLQKYHPLPPLRPPVGSPRQPQCAHGGRVPRTPQTSGLKRR
jgi:hypothetical protein